MKLKIKKVILVGFLSTLAACSSQVATEQTQTTQADKATTSTGLHEDKSIYANDNHDVVHLYVTVSEQNQYDQSKGTFSNLNHFYDFHSTAEDSPQLDVLVQEGTEQGPAQSKFGFGATQPNAIFEIRGASNRVAAQKSYKIKLSDQAGKWNGQTTINLNKHSYDFLRIRNKLSFDLLKRVPNITSLRTQLVELHVKDLTAGSDTFVDYGLYTHVEQPNEDFLAAHGLNQFGQLYKAKDFDYSRFPDQLKLSTDASYNKEAFESVLEIKGNSDHQKLINMLDALNDTNQNINDVMDRYFDRENYLTWLSTNILFGNLDTISLNFYLYSPTNEDKFYLLPWDYDGAWDWEKQIPAGMEKPVTPPWEVGVSNYWSDILHQRFIKDPSNLKDLENKIEEVSQLITKEDIKSLLDSYYPVVHRAVTNSPDSLNLPLPLEHYDSYYWDLVNVIERNKQSFYDSLESPMPIFLGEAVQESSGYRFTWDYSFDLQNDELTYDFEIANDPGFSQVVYSQADLNGNSVQVPALSSGVYYWRVTVKDGKGNKQVAFDWLEDTDGQVYYGVKQVSIQ